MMVEAGIRRSDRIPRMDRSKNTLPNLDTYLGRVSLDRQARAGMWDEGSYKY
jgi:hypothetical protein